MLDFAPTEEQALIVETVRQFAENEIRPKARACDESASLPADVLSTAHELGLVANALPEAHGGGGERSAVTGVLVIEELCWGDLSIGLGCLTPALIGLPVADYGSEQLKKQVLPALTGDEFAPGAFAVTEPRFDCDVFKPQTTAKRDGDTVILDGAKCQVPWAPGIDTALVLAQEDGALAAYVVPADATGLTATREKNLGLHALELHELTLAGVRVPASARLDASDAQLRDLIHRGRVGVAAAGIGMSRAAFEISRDYAKERETFGQPIATRQAIAFKLAEMAIEIDAARMLVWEAAYLLDQGADVTREATLAYDQTARMALGVADNAVQIFGGHGYIRDYLPELFLRNAAGFASFEALTLV